MTRAQHLGRLDRARKAWGIAWNAWCKAVEDAKAGGIDVKMSGRFSVEYPPDMPADPGFIKRAEAHFKRLERE